MYLILIIALAKIHHQNYTEDLSIHRQFPENKVLLLIFKNLYKVVLLQFKL